MDIAWSKGGTTTLGRVGEDGEIGEHEYARLIRELFWYCPPKYRPAVWGDSAAQFWAWKEQELLHRMYFERGFYEKLRKVVDEWKAIRLAPSFVTHPVVEEGRKRHYDRKNGSGNVKVVKGIVGPRLHHRNQS